MFICVSRVCIFQIEEAPQELKKYLLFRPQCFGKFFTYVTKTCANLTTCSREPENYNGTIIFEIDIMKNSSPINLNLCQT